MCFVLVEKWQNLIFEHVNTKNSMKPTLIFYTVLSLYSPNTEAINIFKYFLCGGRPDAYKTQKILPVNSDIDQGTPNSSPMSSESISIDHWDSKVQRSKQVKLQHEEEGQVQDQDDHLKIKSVLKKKKKKKKKKHHRKNAAVVPISEYFENNEFSDIDSPQQEIEQEQDQDHLKIESVRKKDNYWKKAAVVCNENHNR
jgi:hypothetical protein